MRKIKKFSVLLVCLLVGLTSFMFVGCGNDANTIRLNEVTRSIFYAPLYVAKNMGFFEEQGLSVKIETGTGSDSSMSALLSGSADVALVGPETVVYSAAKKDHPVVFGQLTQRDGSFIVSRNEIQGEFTLDMLRGTTIIGGRNGGLPAMTLEYIIKQAGLTIGKDTANGHVNLRDDVAFPNIGSVYEVSNAEFCTLFEPTATNMVKKGSGYIVSSVGKFSGSIPYTCFTAKQSFLKNKSEQAEKFLTAVYNGYKYIENNNSLTVAKALEKTFVGMTTEELQVAIEKYLELEAWCKSPAMSEVSFNKLVEIINGHEQLKITPVFDQLVDNTIANKIVVA